jgi:hypothetical protein
MFMCVVKCQRCALQLAGYQYPRSAKDMQDHDMYACQQPDNPSPWPSNPPLPPSWWIGAGGAAGRPGRV